MTVLKSKLATKQALFHCGPSSKDAGNRIGTIMKIENAIDYYKMIDNLAKCFSSNNKLL